jgi:hypothetical protein
MAKFLVQNLSNRVIRLGIEPWADLEVLAPKAQVTFEYTEPAEIEIHKYWLTIESEYQ